MSGMTWDVAGWYAVAMVSMVGTALSSGAEIGIFSLSRVRLRLRMHHRDHAAMTLHQWLEKPTYALEGLLVLQNICGYAFSTAVTKILGAHGFSEVWEGVISTLIVAPILLVFCDILPKDLFNSYADRWIYRLVPAIRWAFMVLTATAILPAVRVLSRFSTHFFARGRADETPLGPRHEMVKLFQESTATGVMTDTQQDLVQRALQMARITVREVMMPWNRVIGIPATISREGFRALARHYQVSRMPVLGRAMADVLGFIDILEVLGDAGDFSINRHVQPAMTLIAEQSVRSAITLMQKARQTIAVVVDRQGRAIGLVTMKDLIEELIGDVESW